MWRGKGSEYEIEKGRGVRERGREEGKLDMERKGK